jgi:hypothetical protein
LYLSAALKAQKLLKTCSGENYETEAMGRLPGQIPAKDQHHRTTELVRALLLLLFRAIILAIATGIPTRMRHRSWSDFLVMSTDAVMAAARFFRAKRIKAAVGHG